MMKKYLWMMTASCVLGLFAAGCGKIDNDPDRLGKSVRRINTAGKLADTDNSTNDFQKDSKPSIK